MVIDIFGDFTSHRNSYLPLLRSLDLIKDVKINIMGPVHPSIIHLQARKYEKGNIAIGIGQPREFVGLYEGDYQLKMGITSWETDKVPYGAYYGSRKILEDLDCLLVHSKYQKRLFSDVNKNIHVLHRAIYNWTEYRKRKILSPLRVLVSVDHPYRGSIGLILASFIELHKDLPIKLTIKSETGALGHLDLPYENLNIIDRVLNESQIRYLINSNDYFLSMDMADSDPTMLLTAAASGMKIISPTKFSRYELLEEGIIDLPIMGGDKSKAQRYSRKLGDVGNYYTYDKEFLNKAILTAPALLEVDENLRKSATHRYRPNMVAKSLISIIKSQL